MRKLVAISKRFVSDERGAEVTELGIVLALIVAGCVLLIQSIGVSVVGGYNTVDGALP